MRPLADQSRMVVPLMKSPTSDCEASIHCPSPVRARWKRRAEHGQGEAVGAHPVEVGVAPPRRHRRLGQPRHLRQAGKGVRDRAHGAKAAVGALRAHARLLDVDDVRLDGAQRVVSQAPAVEHARREALRDDVRHRHQAPGDLQALRMPDVQRDPALAGVLVVELPAHVGVGHAGQRRRGPLAGGATADRAPWRPCACPGGSSARP